MDSDFGTQRPNTSNLKACPFCAEEIQAAAMKCKHCGEFLSATHPGGARPQTFSEDISLFGTPRDTWDPAIAGIFSFLWAGVGQIYKGDTKRGLYWMIGVFVGYLLFFVPGFIAHIFCVIDAVKQPVEIPPRNGPPTF